jgi:hypothetical protein
MFDEVWLFIYGTAAAVILIGIVAYYYMPTLVGAAQAQAEYAALRDAAPILILAQDGKSVHICINSTAPQRVLLQKTVWMDAQRDCRIDPGGNCVSGGHQSWPFCRWYLGTYRPGDNITIVLKTDRASVVKSYRIAAVAPSARLSASNIATSGQNATGGQGSTQATTVTLTGTVYSTTVVTVTTTVTSYGTTTVTVTAPNTVTVTHTVIIRDPSFTTTRTLMACVPTNTTRTTTRPFPIIEPFRHGFQPPFAATSTVTSYTTIYTTSYTTSTATTTVWLTSTLTYTPTVTTTVTRLQPGVEVTCYVCLTPTPSRTCTTTTLVTTTSVTTITGRTSSAQPNTPNGGLTIDTFILGLSAVAMMAGSVMLIKRQ